MSVHASRHVSTGYACQKVSWGTTHNTNHTTAQRNYIYNYILQLQCTDAHRTVQAVNLRADARAHEVQKTKKDGVCQLPKHAASNNTQHAMLMLQNPVACHAIAHHPRSHKTARATDKLSSKRHLNNTPQKIRHIAHATPYQREKQPSTISAWSKLRLHASPPSALLLALAVLTLGIRPLAILVSACSALLHSLHLRHTSRRQVSAPERLRLCGRFLSH